MGKKNEVVKIVPKKRKSTGKKVIKVVVAIAAMNGALKLYSMYKENKENEQDNNKDNSVKKYNVYMNGRQIKLDGEAIQGVFIKTIMGGVDLDLRKAIITEDVFITCKGVMSGISIRVPEHVNVSVDVKGFMNGISNTVPKHFEDEVNTIYIDGDCAMSGISVRQSMDEENNHKDKEKKCCCSECDTVDESVFEEE